MILATIGYGQTSSAEDEYRLFLTTELTVDSLQGLGLHMAKVHGSDNVYVRLVLAHAAIASRDLEGSEKALAKLVDDKLNFQSDKVRGRIHYARAEYCRKFGMAEDCLLFLDSAIQFAELARDTLGLSWALGRRSITLRRKGDPDEALASGIRSLELAKSTEEPFRIAQAYMTLGNVYFRMLKDFRKAEEYFRASLSICEQNGYARKANILHYNLGNTYLELEDWPLALEQLERYTTTSQERGDRYGQAHGHRGLGLVHKRMGSFGPASEEYHLALNLYLRLESIGDLAKIHNHLAALHLAQGNNDSAAFYARSSISFGEQSQDLRTLRDAYTNLSVAASEAGRFESALEYHREAKTLNDSILAMQYDNSLLEMAAKYEAVEKERQLELSQIELEKQTAENEKKAFQRNIMIAVSVLLLIFIGVYTNIQSKKRRLSIQLAQAQIDDVVRDQELKLLEASIEGQENERQRVAQDLHDRIGSLLSAVRMKFNKIEQQVDDPEMEKGMGLLDRSLSEVRRISQDMASGTLVKFGLEGAVRDLVHTFDFADQVEFSVHFHGLEARLPSDIERAIFRLVQESVSNALKHSGCKIIDIQINRLDGMVNLMVEDDGKGFDTRSYSVKGMGLKGMRARVEKFKGTMHIDTAKGRGTTINIDIPVASGL